jgi:7-carboxy-7-deazaguanine synthase
MNLPINEIFSSVQGEGSYTGTPSVFVRLQYCQISCPWCDTKHTWQKDDLRKISFAEMLGKQKDSDEWCDTPIETLLAFLTTQPERHIVITGGEPCNYDLTELTSSLLLAGKQPQIETSGTIKVKAHGNTFVTVSPKFDMPGGLKVLDPDLLIADEIKMPVGKIADVEKLKALLKHNFFDVPVYLQPLSQNEKATELCIEQARQNGWRLSAQLHKYLKVR